MKHSQSTRCAWSGALCLVIYTMVSVKAPAAPIARVMVSKIKDGRESSSGRMHIQLKMQTPLVKQAQELRTVVKVAVDETGRDLLDPKQQCNAPFGDFREPGWWDADGAELEIELNSPQRNAKKLKQLAGEVEFYLPKNDPSSIIKVNNFKQHLGKPLVSSTLKAEGLTIVLWTKDQYTKASASRGVEIERSQQLSEVFNDTSGRFNTSNTIVFHVKDPKARLVTLGLEDARGQRIHSVNGSYTIGYTQDILRVFNFDKSVPSDAHVKLYVATSKSITTVPFQFKDLTLP